MDDHLLLCLRGGELRLSHKRDLSARALAMAFFFAVSTAIVDMGPRAVRRPDRRGLADQHVRSYFLGATLMLAAALIAFRFGVAAERKPLEAVAMTLPAAD